MLATHLCLLGLVLLCIWQVEASRGCMPVKAAKCRKQIAHCAVCRGCNGKATSCKRCDAGWGNCDTSKPDCETNLNTTAAHCGACNTPCRPGQTCEAGLCVGGEPELPDGAGSLAVTMDADIASTCEDPDRVIHGRQGACDSTRNGYTLNIPKQWLEGMLDYPQNPPRCVVVSTCDQQGSTAWDSPDAQLTMEWNGVCAAQGDCEPDTGLVTGLATGLGTGTRLLVEYRGTDEIVTFGNAAGSVCGKPLRVRITASFDCIML